MIEPDDNGLMELLERAANARSAADEQAMRNWIAARPADERASWEQLVAEVRDAREAISDVPVPPGLELQLARIADAPPPWHWRDLLHYQLKNWQIAMAVAAIAIVVGISIWPSEPPRQPMLAEQTIKLISGAAMNQQSKSLALAGDDAKVLATLKAAHLPFEAKLPRTKGTLTLEGATITNFGNAAAVQSKWHGTSGDFTLYQFDAKSLSLPIGFSTAVLNLGTPPQQVTIWPGRSDSYAWALVGNPGCEDNPFFELCDSE